MAAAAMTGQPQAQPYGQPPYDTYETYGAHPPMPMNWSPPPQPQMPGFIPAHNTSIGNI